MTAPKFAPPADFFPKDEPSAKCLKAAADLDRMIAPKVEQLSERRYRMTPKQIRTAQEEMDRMAEAGEWGRAFGKHVVALYAWMHQAVYGVEATDMTPEEWAVASSTATSFVRREFADDFAKAVLFVRWTWKREHEREQWRRANGREGGRIGWRLQFSARLVTDYRVAQARQSPER